MKRGTIPGGYTIVEVMIVLVVTGALFGSAVLLVQGQQAKTQFSQGLRDLDSQIRDAMNDVGTGQYPDTGNFDCLVSGSPGNINFSSPAVPGGGGQGTKTSCTFIGKVMQFGVHKAQCTSSIDTDECDRFNIYTMVGLREKSGGGIIKTLKDARPTVLYQSSVPVVANATEQLTAQYGLHVTKIYSNTGGLTDYGSVGFFTTFGTPSGVGDLVSGAHTTDLVVIPNTAIGQPDFSGGSNAVNIINNMKNLSDATITSHTNPSSGVVICVEGPGNKQGAITIGSNDRRLTTEVLVDQRPAGCP
jgi:type II secretory pathway pseudopilin PulG